MHGTGRRYPTRREDDLAEREAIMLEGCNMAIEPLEGPPTWERFSAPGYELPRPPPLAAAPQVAEPGQPNRQSMEEPPERPNQARLHSRATHPANLVASLLARKKEHLSTGLPTLDKLTRGGLEAPGFVVIQGAPEAGKTTIAVQLGAKWAQEGHAVVVLSSDETQTDTLTRFGQLANATLGDLEERNPEALALLTAYVLGMPGISMLDGAGDNDDSVKTVDDAIEEALSIAGELAPTAIPIVIIDSLQTVLVRGYDDMTKDPRTRVDSVVRACKRGRGRGCLIVATSEVARLHYGSGTQRDEMNPMAAGKESGGIEYGANLVVLLRALQAHAGVVRAIVPKAKRGTTGTFHLAFTEIDRPEYAEVQPPVEATGTESSGSRRAPRKAVDHGPRFREKLLKIVAETPGITITQVRQKEGGAASEWTRALEAATTAGTIETRPQGGRATGLYVAEPPSARGATP